jgi:hypothetical protein
MQGKKQPMMPESSEAGAPQKLQQTLCNNQKCERSHAFRNLARMFFENWEFVLGSYISYGCSKTD